MRERKTKLVATVLVAVVSALGLAAYAMGAIGGDPGPIQTDGPFVGWEAQGSLKDDSSLLAEATAAWDKSDPTESPHTQTRVLFAGTSAEGGYGPSGGEDQTDGVVVVLQGKDADGSVDISYFTDLDWWSGLVAASGPLRLVAEQELGDPEGIRAIGALADSSGGGGPMAIGLAEPGASIESFLSSDWHSYSSRDSASALWLDVLPKGASPERTTMIVKRGGDVIQEDSLRPNSGSK